MSFNTAYFVHFTLHEQIKNDAASPTKYQLDLPVERVPFHELGIVSKSGIHDLIIKIPSPTLLSLVNEMTNTEHDRIQEIVIFMEILTQISSGDEEGFVDELDMLNRLLDARHAEVIILDLVCTFVVPHDLTGDTDQFMGITPTVLGGSRIPSIDAVGKVLLRRLDVEISDLDLEDEHPIILVDEAVVKIVILLELFEGFSIMLVGEEVGTFAASACEVGSVILRSSSAVLLDLKALNNHGDCGWFKASNCEEKK